MSSVAVRDLTLSGSAASGSVLALQFSSFADVTIERVKVTDCAYALKADTECQSDRARFRRSGSRAGIPVQRDRRAFLSGSTWTWLPRWRARRPGTRSTYAPTTTISSFAMSALAGVPAGPSSCTPTSARSSPSDDISFTGLDVEGSTPSSLEMASRMSASRTSTPTPPVPTIPASGCTLLVRCSSRTSPVPGARPFFDHRNPAGHNHQKRQLRREALGGPCTDSDPSTW